VKSGRIVVVGAMAAHPYAGMAWMHMQITAGLARLGYDVYYFEIGSNWPYDPLRHTKVNDSDYAVPYLARVAERFGLGDRWAYRRSYSDKEWLGLPKAKAEDLLLHADALFNVSGTTTLEGEDMQVGRWIYFGTDPVFHEIGYANGDAVARSLIDEHVACVTYGENIGNPDCPIPPLPRLKARTRQPVLLDFWECGPPTREEFTTVCNWKQVGHDVVLNGETYYWSKDREFLKFLDLPLRVSQPLEMATNVSEARAFRAPARGEAIAGVGVAAEGRSLLEANGWRLVESQFTLDPFAYRDYVQASKGEFTVAKDQNVRLRSGWFSERDACYLAAGRPVICQDTGLAGILPTGEGLFVFNTMDEILAAFDAIQSDYQRHGRAARVLAEEYFRAETVLTRLMNDLGL
jgi:hypothetical protein